MINTDFSHYGNKFKENLERCRSVCDVVLGKLRIKEEDLPSLLTSDDGRLQKVCEMMVRSYTPTMSCTSYASAVASICERCGIAYSVFCGFCVPRDSPNYEKEKANAQKMASFNNHCWLEADGRVYEHFSRFHEIEHFTRNMIV